MANRRRTARQLKEFKIMSVYNALIHFFVAEHLKKHNSCYATNMYVDSCHNKTQGLAEPKRFLGSVNFTGKELDLIFSKSNSV